MRPQKTQNWLRQLSLRPPKKSPRFGQVSWRFSSAREFPQLTPTQNSSAQGRDTGQRWRAELQWNSTRDQPIPRLLRRRHALKILNLFEPMKLTMKSPKCMVEKYNFSPTKLSF